MMMQGYKQMMEDKLYLKWLHDSSGMSFGDYKNQAMGQTYEKTPPDQREYILKKFLKEG